MICIMKGIAAKTPIWKLVAPSVRAKATNIPLVVMLLKPMETVPSQVNQRSPVVNSSSEMVGLGFRNVNVFMIVTFVVQFRDFLIIHESNPGVP